MKRDHYRPQLFGITDKIPSADDLFIYKRNNMFDLTIHFSLSLDPPESFFIYGTYNSKRIITLSGKLPFLADLIKTAF